MFTVKKAPAVRACIATIAMFVLLLLLESILPANEAAANQPPPPPPPSTYTLTVNRSGGDSTCEVMIDSPEPSDWTSTSVTDSFPVGSEYEPAQRVLCPSDYEFSHWESNDPDLDGYRENHAPDFELSQDTVATAVFVEKPRVVNFRCHESTFNRAEDPCTMAPAGTLVTEYRFDSSSGYISGLRGSILEVLCYDTSVSFNQDVLPWLQSKDPQVTRGPDFTDASQVIGEPWYSKYLSYMGGIYPKRVTWANTDIDDLPKVDAMTAFFKDNNGIAATPSETQVTGEYNIKQFMIWDKGCGAFELLSTLTVNRKSYGTGKKISITKTPGCPGGEQTVECVTGW